MKSISEQIEIVDKERQETIKTLLKEVSRARLAKKASKLIDAKLTKTFYDKDTGIVYSKPLDDNSTQVKMVSVLAAIYWSKATENHNLNVHGDIAMLLKEIEGTSLGPPSLRGKAGKP